MWNSKTYHGLAENFEELEALDLSLRNPDDIYDLTGEDADQLLAVTSAAKEILKTLPGDAYVQINAHGHGEHDTQPNSVISIEVAIVPAPISDE